MPEQQGFELRPVRGRSIVRLRLRPGGAAAAAEALKLPLQAGHWRAGDPAAHWLGPEEWLLSSDRQSAADMIRAIGKALAGQLHAATDLSSGNACFSLRGPAARRLLAMGCGIDMHAGSFQVGQCARTRFALMAVLIVAIGEQQFDLYFDASQERYLADWLAGAGRDPMLASELM